MILPLEPYEPKTLKTNLFYGFIVIVSAVLMTLIGAVVIGEFANQILTLSSDVTVGPIYYHGMFYIITAIIVVGLIIYFRFISGNYKESEAREADALRVSSRSPESEEECP